MSKKLVILLTLLTLFTFVNCGFTFLIAAGAQTQINELALAGATMADTYGEAIINLQNTNDNILELINILADDQFETNDQLDTIMPKIISNLDAIKSQIKEFNQQLNETNQSITRIWVQLYQWHRK